MKLFFNSSFCYPTTSCSRHFSTKHLNHNKFQIAINGNLFIRLSYILVKVYEVEFIKPEIERPESIIDGFIILQNNKLWMLDLQYILLKRFSDSDKFENFWMYTDSLYLALSNENMQDIVLLEKQKVVESTIFWSLYGIFHRKRNSHFVSQNLKRHTEGPQQERTGSLQRNVWMLWNVVSPQQNLLFLKSREQ